MASEETLLINGYMRKNVKILKINDIYPKCLNNVIMAYFGKLWDVSFDSFPSCYQNHIQDNGKLIKRLHSKFYSPYIICSSTATSSGKIHEFSMKCITPKHDAIGIISSTVNCNKRNNFWSMAQGNLYYYWGGGKISHGMNTINATNTCDQYAPVAKWEKDDIITVHIDCNQWIVQFFRNNEQVGNDVDIVPNIKYYPMMGLQTNDAEYQIIDS